MVRGDYKTALLKLLFEMVMGEDGESEPEPRPAEPPMVKLATSPVGG